VQYRASDTNAADNQIKPHFNVVNVGTTSIPLRELTIRYWYTKDGDRPEVYWCDYAAIGCSNVSGRFVTLTAPEIGADSYLEISFAAGAGTLAPGGQTGEIQNRFNKDNYSNYNEADDYSFDPARTAFSDWMRVTLYHNGGLIWGVDPACASGRDGSGCSGDAGADVVSIDGNPDVDTSDTVSTDVASDVPRDITSTDVSPVDAPKDSMDAPAVGDSGLADSGTDP